MGLSASALYYYSKLVSKLNGLVNDKKQQSKLARAQLREDELAIKVSKAIEQLQTLEQHISIVAIARIVKVSDSTLRRYPKVLAILKQIPQNVVNNR